MSGIREWRSWALRRASPIWRAPLTNPFVEAIAVLLGGWLLLSVAIWNGFPLIFYDTGAYILQGLGRVFVAERSPVYSLFLDNAGGARSLWLVAIVQAAMVTFVLAETARCLLHHIGIGLFLLVVLLLVLLTGLPWYVGQIEPDCFTALMVLCSYLLTFHASRLGWIRGALILAIGAFAAGTHPSHILLIAGLVAVAAVFKILSIVHHNRPALAHANVMLPLLSAILGLALIVASNYELTHKIFLNRAGSVFVFASLLQDGLVQPLLDDKCATEHYALCAYKDHLPLTAERWLWFPESPFHRLGAFKGSAAESQRIVIDIIRNYPLGVFLSTMRDTAAQLVTFRTGDQIEPQEWVLYPDLDRFIPRQMAGYMSARQQQGRIHFGLINAVDLSVAALGQMGLIWMFVLAVRRRRWSVAILMGFLAVALLGNAFICGALSNPHDRYQSRLVWMPVFALVLMGTDRLFSLRLRAESGT